MAKKFPTEAVTLRNMEVLRTQWVIQGVLFLLGGLVMGGTVYLNLSIAYRTRPVYAPITAEQQKRVVETLRDSTG